MLTFTIDNFRGISHETIVLDHLNILLGKNGRGKTSTLSAIAFALTGKAKETDIRKDADSASVSIDFDDDDSFARVVFPTARLSQSCFINGEKVQKATAEKFLEGKFGCAADTLNSLLTEDLLAGDMSKMLYDILPVNCAKDTFFNLLKEYKGVDLTPEEKAIPEEYLVAHNISTITFAHIDAMYKEMYAKRREVKALFKDATSQALFDNERIASLLPEALLKEKRDDLLRKNGMLSEMKKRQADYERQVLQRENALKEKKSLEERLAALKDVTMPDAREEEKLREEKKKFEQVILAKQKTKATLESNNKMFQKVLENIASSVCPIHPDIKCTTDKSAFGEEIQTQIMANSNAMDEISDFILRCQEQVEKREKMLADLQKVALEYQKKTMLEDQVKNFLLPALPEKPVLPKTEDYTPQIAAMDKDLAVWAEYRVACKAKEKSLALENTVAVYEFLVSAFAPKGIKALIVARVLDPLKDACNQMAKTLNPNLELQFLIGNKGLEILARFHEEFVPVSTLSSGEKVIVLYLIMELIHKITHANIMAIDNLDRLDKDNMQKLFNLLENSNSFSWLLFGSVDHNDTVETIAGRDVQSIEFS